MQLFIGICFSTAFIAINNKRNIIIITNNNKEYY